MSMSFQHRALRIDFVVVGIDILTCLSEMWSDFRIPSAQRLVGRSLNTVIHTLGLCGQCLIPAEDDLRCDSLLGGKPLGETLRKSEWNVSWLGQATTHRPVRAHNHTRKSIL